MYVEYNSNNSGGHWWLDDNQWRALEAAGWKVAWYRLEHLYNEEGSHVIDDDGTPKLVPIRQGNYPFGLFVQRGSDGEYRFFGGLAQKAYRSGATLKDAVAEWEMITGISSTSDGCPCCGRPHSFTQYDDGGKCSDRCTTVSYDARRDDYDEDSED